MRREERAWGEAVRYGLGHGGLGSMVLVGGLTLFGLVNLLILPSMIGTLPAEQRALVEQQLAAVGGQPDWLPLLGAWERVWSIAFHVALSVVVLQVFRRGSLRWLWLAIALHAGVDFVAAGLPVLLPLDPRTRLVLPEAIIAVVGLISLWAIWRLRDRPSAAEVPGENLHSEPPSVPLLDDTRE